MPQVRAGGAKWRQRAGMAADAYKSGVLTPRADWQQATAAAESNYTQGVQEAIAAGRFGRGVNRADAKTAYLKGVTTKGPSRFVEGVQQSGDAYDKGFAPYKAAIQALTLSPRGRRGDPANLQRVAEVASTLNKVRKDLLGG